MTAPATVVGIVAVINVPLNYALVYSSHGFGFIGAPIASAISMDLMAIISLIYCCFFAPKTAWGGFSMEMFRDWGDSLKLGLAGVVRTRAFTSCCMANLVRL